MNNDINDIRDKNDFSKLSFSNFKKTDVTKELIKSFKNSNYEAACYWTAELVCGGHFIELWECIILYMSKSIIETSLNGTISVENFCFNYNEDNYVGAKFILTIPIKY